VDSGYIVYVGTGEDFTAERAEFKSEASAIQDIANECSFAPKGTRVEDHYDYFYNGKYQSFSKVAVQFEDCDAAKQTLKPEQIQALANAQMTDQLKHYQELEYDMPSATAVATSDSSSESGTNPALDSTLAPPAVNPIMDDGRFLIVRQQVAYEKEIVILSPLSAYPPGSPQSQTFVAAIRTPMTQIQHYEQVHPGVHTWSKSWSSFERHPSAPLPGSIPRPRAYRGAIDSGSQHRGRGEGYKNGQNGGRHGLGFGRHGRRRRWPYPQ